MPKTEREALEILKEEGFKNIHWESLINWNSPYDFKATYNGVEYLIEVKPNKTLASRAISKIQHLKQLGKPVLFLIVNKDKHYFIPLEKIKLKKIPKSQKRKKRGVKVQKIGQSFYILIPKKIAEKANVSEGDLFLLVEATPNKLVFKRIVPAGFEWRLVPCQESQ